MNEKKESDGERVWRAAQRNQTSLAPTCCGRVRPTAEGERLGKGDSLWEEWFPGGSSSPVGRPGREQGMQTGRKRRGYSPSCRQRRGRCQLHTRRRHQGRCSRAGACRFHTHTVMRAFKSPRSWHRDGEAKGQEGGPYDKGGRVRSRLACAYCIFGSSGGDGGGLARG